MSFPYEGPQNELRLRVRPTPHQLERMADLPMKQSAPLARPVVRKNRTTPKSTWQEREKAAKAKVKQVQNKSANIKRQSSPKLAKANEKLLKQTPAFKENQHPRDRFGRFAVKAVKATGKAIKATAKGVGKVARGTAKTVKRINADMRRRDELAHRERKLDLHKREVAAGLKKPRTVRRKKAASPAKKKGGLFSFLRGAKKKQVRRKR